MPRPDLLHDRLAGDDFSITEGLDPAVSYLGPDVITVDASEILDLDKAVLAPVPEPGLTVRFGMGYPCREDHNAGDDTDGIEDLWRHGHDGFKGVALEEITLVVTRCRGTGDRYDGDSSCAWL